MEINLGDFIYHTYHGVGRIETSDVSSGNENAEFAVKFQTGEVKTFTQELLDRGARKISPLGFRAYAFLDESGARELLDKSPIEAITMVLQDFPGLVAKNEDLKEYLAAYIPNWADWWETVQPKLKDSPQIDTSRSKFREYGLRTDSLSQAEEHYRAFQRTRSFEDKAKVYDMARNTLKHYLDGKSLSTEHLQEVLDYVKQFIESEKNSPVARLDAVFRLQEGKWLSNDESAEYISKVLQSGVRLYQLDLYSLNRTVEFLLKNPDVKDAKAILASAICSVESAIKAVCDWALERGDSGFVTLLLETGLSENIPPWLEKDSLDALSIRLKHLGLLTKGVEAENPVWTLVISRFQNLVKAISELDEKIVASLFPSLLEFSQALYQRLNSHRPDFMDNVFAGFFAPNISKSFVLGVLDFARKSKNFSYYGVMLEQRLWSDGEGRNFDFIKELIQSKGSTIEQVKSLLEIAERYTSSALNGHVGEVVCGLIKKDEITNRSLFLPYLNKLYSWEGEWGWSATVQGLREEIYLEMLEGSSKEAGDQALTSAVHRFLRTRTQVLDLEVQGLKGDVQKSEQKIHELESLLAEKEQVVRELRGSYGGDTAQARFNERVRVVKDLASSVAEFERMEAKSKEKSREVQAVILRLNSLLAGLSVTPMEAIGEQVQFSPQKHQAIDSSVVEPSETVVIVERGYLIRDHNEKNRLLKSALVKKP